MAARLNTADSAAALRRKTHDIITAATALQTLISDVIDLGAMETGKQTLHLDSFEVRDIVTRVANMTLETVRRRGIALEVDCPPSTGWMVGDATRIKQSLYHLLNSALKATDDGGRLALTAERGGDGMVTFALKHGNGEAESLGLAIYLARRIAQMHGGQIDMTGDADGGVILCRLPSGAASSQPLSGRA